MSHSTVFGSTAICAAAGWRPARLPQGRPRDGDALLLRVMDRFQPVSLDELGSTASRDRIDTKFVVPRIRLLALLEWCAPHYRILEIGGRRALRYWTLYFDTRALTLYHDHHAGRLPRHKVRLRSYEDTGARFLEAKTKTNRGRTLKARLPVGEGPPDLPALLTKGAFAGLGPALSSDELLPALTVEYTRLTLVAVQGVERVTLDLSPTFSTSLSEVSYRDAAIVEIKQESRGTSRLLEITRRLSLRPTSISKYCVGIATLSPSVKRNRFRPALRLLEQTSGEVVRSRTVHHPF